MSERPPAELATARSRAYGLLARLLVEGPSPELLPRLADTPLAGELPDPLDPDELAAAHYALLHLELHPYAGVFLDAEALLGGPSAAAFAGDCRRLGFGASLDDQADHIGNILALLSFLVGAEADAVEDGHGAIAEALRRHQARVLDRWLLSWLVPFAGAALSRPRPLWSAVFELIVELAIEHRVALGGPSRPPPLPEPPADLLDDPETGLKRIARTLLTPCLSGVFLSRSDIAALSRDQETPAGFGGRLHTLNNLLRNAAEYRSFPGLIAALDGLLQRRLAAAEHLEARGLPGVLIRPWRSRIGQSRSMLRTLADAGSPGPSSA